jgi:hypothetical protein
MRCDICGSTEFVTVTGAARAAFPSGKRCAYHFTHPRRRVFRVRDDAMYCDAKTRPYGFDVPCHRYKDHIGEHIGHVQESRVGPFKVHWNAEATEVTP